MSSTAEARTLTDVLPVPGLFPTAVEKKQVTPSRKYLKQKRAVETWNKTHPVGTRVEVRDRDGNMVETETKSAAFLMGGHTPVVTLKDVSGHFFLEKVCDIK